MIADEERIEHCDAIHSVKEDRWVVPGYGEGIVNIVYTMCGDAARLIPARTSNAIRGQIFSAQEFRSFLQEIISGQSELLKPEIGIISTEITGLEEKQQVSTGNF